MSDVVVRGKDGEHVRSSVLQEVRLVGPDGAAQAVHGQHDGEADRDLRGLGGDDEEGEHLPGVALARGDLGDAVAPGASG